MAAEKNTSSYDALYMRLRNDRNSHAVDFSIGANNNGFLAYEQTGVEVTNGVYATRAGILLPVHTPEQIVHARPTITNEGTVIKVWEPTLDPMLFQDDSSMLESALDNYLGPDKGRYSAVDRVLGTMDGPGVESHDLTIGGVTISGVTFQAQSYYLPPNVFASNKFFNKMSAEISDDGLDFKVISMTDLAAKQPMVFIDGLRDNAPSASSVSAAAPEDKLALYEAASKLFLKNQMAVNTGIYLAIEFNVAGEVEKGNKAGKTATVTNLFQGFSLG